MVISTQNDISGAVTAAACVVKIHEALAESIRAGLTLAEIDGMVGEVLKKLKCKSAFYRYRMQGHPPFPSLSCLSLNECIVHGTHTMSSQPIEPGDLLSIDIGVVHQGWFGDAAWTYAIEHASDEGLKLMEAGKESLRKGIAAMQPGRPLMDWAKAVHTCVEDDWGFALVRNLGGHGYGRKLHGPPFISNLIPEHRAEWPDAWKLFEPGLLVAVEPMLSISTGETRSDLRKWPIYTEDGSLSVHYEADVLITEGGPKNLTEGMCNLPDIVGL